MDELSQLLVDARAGRDGAFASFVSASQADVWRLCAHLIGPGDADDATQETYMGAWRALSSFRGESSARTWLFVIARRSAQRLARRRRSLSELDRAATAPTETPGPERGVELAGLVDRLDEDRRLALVLTQVFGFSYAEAAQVCRCPVGTIRSRVARAREDLLESWSGDGAGRAGPSRTLRQGRQAGPRHRSGRLEAQPCGPEDGVGLAGASGG
jgi:RNA polymerase sigma-70 factor, ECF subfamily